MRQASSPTCEVIGAVVAKKVSVVIPCFNAERWVAQAIQSCLDQTYRPIEVIVVDDGSTDNSLEKIMFYAEAFPDIVKGVSCSNGGPSEARNRGLAHISGSYLQYLDADDLLFPDKLARQVQYLESDPATDIVYGDWCYLFQNKDNPPRRGDVCVMAPVEDPLEARLSGWWAPLNAFLSRVQTAASWDSATLPCDDHDYWVQVAMKGHTFSYQQGCDTLYRSYGDASFSQRNIVSWIHGQGRVLEKAENLLRTAGRLDEKYKTALARSHFFLMQNYKGIDEERFCHHKDKVFTLDPAFRPRHKSILYQIFHALLGTGCTEELALQKRRRLNHSKGISC